MTEQNKEQTPPEAPKEKPKEEFVPRETYEKLLSEKKNYAEKAKLVEQELETIKTNQMKEKEDYKAMYEMSLKKATELDVKLKEREENETKSIKLTKIKQEWEKMGLRDSQSAEQLLKIVNLDAIKYDSELKVVLGAEEEAKRISESFMPMFKGTSAKPSHDAPQGTPADVSIDAYNKMVMSPEWRKMSKQDQHAYTAKVYEKMGVTARK